MGDRWEGGGPPNFIRRGIMLWGYMQIRHVVVHMSHIIYLRLTRGCILKLLAMTFNRSFNMLNILLVII